MDTIEITLNGKPFRLSADETIPGLLRLLALPGEGRGLAVAIDGAVVLRSSWESTQLEPGQRVEVLVATQGG